ncbi:MAG: hypothetical protein ABIS07_08130 [Dokdonella sp.]
MKATSSAALLQHTAAILSPAQAIAFVVEHGVVLEASRRGAIASLADAIAGEALNGNWWSHPHNRSIFAATRAVRDCSDVLVCRLVDGKISFVHARLWPALARLANRFPAQRLARLKEIHSATGAHRVEEIPFPQWLPNETATQAQQLSDAQACAALAMLAESAGAA